MPEQQDYFQSYINKLMDIQKNQQDKILSEGELKEIAMGIGFTEKEWQEVQLSFDNHLRRGNGYLQHQNWEDALEEFNQAMALRPGNLKVLFGLAQAYQKKWLKTHDENAKELAEKYAKQCLQIEAGHSEALKLVSELKVKRMIEKPPKGENFLTKYPWLFLLVIMLAGMVYFYFLSRPSSNQNTPLETSKPIADVKEEKGEPAPQDLTPENAIPVQWKEDQNTKKINLRVESSELKAYSNSYSYELKADLIPQSIEIEKLKIKFELLDEKGQTIATSFKDVIQDYEPTVRSGDIYPMDFLLYKDNSTAPNLKEVRLSIQFIEQQEAPATYEPSPKVALEWAFNKPPNYEVEMKERRSVYSQNTYEKNKVRHELVLEFTNKGNNHIKTLKIETEWLDANGKVLFSTDNLVTYSSKPKLKRGESRMMYVLGQIPVASKGLIKKYRVLVSEIE